MWNDQWNMKAASLIFGDRVEEACTGTFQQLGSGFIHS